MARYSEEETRRIRRYTTPIGFASAVILAIFLIWALSFTPWLAITLASVAGVAVTHQIRSTRRDAISQRRRQQKRLGE